MNRLLDKTISVRQIWRWTRRVIYVVIPIYLAAVFMHEWGVKMTMTPIAYKNKIPQHCLAYMGYSSGRFAGQTLMDSLLFRGRVIRGPTIDSIVNDHDQWLACVGYRVIAGLNPSDSARYASFSEEWLDSQGEPVVTIHVEYQKPYPFSQGTSK